MFFESKRLSERREGLKELEELTRDKNKTLIIHYSCESFVTTHGKTPRVTSICIRNFRSGQTKSFSIHLQAQFDKNDFNNLTDEQYDQLEKKMLDDFYQFVKQHKDHRWIHWNMRDANFGFEAIANRYKILGGEPYELDEDRKYDLPRILGKIYTYGYERNEPDGRLLNLANRNKITLRHALKGSDEAKAYEDKKYLELHQSTLRKVDIMDSIVDRTDKNELKVNVKKKDIYGLTLPGIVEIVKNNWMLVALWTLIVYILGAATEPLIQKLFGTAN
ncbi:hypothetical protein [Chryseosolibacter indicus]|uniref:Uncharacterized protein n=1 Tax=Chryseosolibacter indicus TaxID=2782351 RepID=A0ABS5VZY2_9BACT|nr:hypothetical protein [Chryseosolibacter indicus]MBT1706417.1 hypothetical protein [Chryseosolibacter indicus]